MSAARMKKSVGYCLFLLANKKFEVFFWGEGELDTLSAPLNMPLSIDHIRYSQESEITVRSQLIKSRALVEVYWKLCEFFDIRKRTEKLDSTVIVNIAAINIHISVFSRLDNILK